MISNTFSIFTNIFSIFSTVADLYVSTLLLFSSDIVPENIALATDETKPYNIMPVYGTLFYDEYFISYPIPYTRNMTSRFLLIKHSVQLSISYLL